MRARLMPLMLGAVLAVSCSVQSMNRDPPDCLNCTRLAAEEIPLRRVIIDNVDYDTGVHTDWKYFRVPKPGTVKLTIAFDNPDAEIVVFVHDGEGAELARLEHRAEPRLEAEFSATPGVYYLEIKAEAQGSDYTFEVHFEAQAVPEGMDSE